MARSKILRENTDNNILRGKRDIRLEPPRNRSVFKTIDNKFNPDIHVMIPNPNGKGFIQKLKS